MDKIIGKYVFVDDACIEVEELAELEGPIAYEVVRLYHGVPFDLEGHVDRLMGSANALSCTRQWSLQRFKDAIAGLIDANQLINANVKFVVGGEPSQLQAYYVPAVYPVEDVYSTGVALKISKYQRENPHVKAMSEALNTMYQEVKDEGEYFETLLVNDEDVITECSKSNVFFTDGNVVIAPPGEAVLLGITRKHVLAVIESLGMRYEERPIHVHDLMLFDGCFITGTSIGVMPVTKIGAFHMNSHTHKDILAIRRGYNSIVADWITKEEHYV